MLPDTAAGAALWLLVGLLWVGVALYGLSAAWWWVKATLLARVAAPDQATFAQSQSATQRTRPLR
jgi:cytoskeletal protein RodZ